MVHKRYRKRKIVSPTDFVEIKPTLVVKPEISHNSEIRSDGASLFTKNFQKSDSDLLRRQVLSGKLNFTQRPDTQNVFKLIRQKSRSHRTYDKLVNQYHNSVEPILNNPMQLCILPFCQQQHLLLEMGYQLADFIEKSQVCHQNFYSRGDDVFRKQKLLEIESDFERKLAYLKTYHCNIKDSHYQNSIRSAWLLNEF